MVSAIRAEVAAARAAPEAAEKQTYDELQRLTTNAGTRAVFHDAWGRVDFTTDPLRVALQTIADDAHALDLIPATSCTTLVAEGALG